MRIKGVIFDLDGTLVDSRLDFGLIRREMGVPPGQPILEYVDSLADPAEKRKMLGILHEYEVSGARRATLIPGAWDFLRLLGEAGLRKAILTRNFADATALAMERLDLRGFAPVMTRENARPKPDPDGLFKICEAWSISPEEALFIGDYKFDLRAGSAAGMKTVLFTEEHPMPEYAHEAAATIRSFPADLTQFHELLKLMQLA